MTEKNKKKKQRDLNIKAFNIVKKATKEKPDNKNQDKESDRNSK